MSGPDDRQPVTVAEIIDILERVGCQFWACEGPGRRIEDMVTCIRCSVLRQLYRGDPVEDDRQGPTDPAQYAAGNNTKP